MVSGDDQTAQDDHGNSWRREVNQYLFFVGSFFFGWRRIVEC